MIEAIKHFFLKLFSAKYRDYLLIKKEVESRFGKEVGSRVKFDKKGFAVVPDANGALKRQMEAEAKAQRPVMPRSEVLCKQCFKPMFVSFGQHAETHRACRAMYRRKKRSIYA